MNKELARLYKEKAKKPPKFAGSCKREKHSQLISRRGPGKSESWKEACQKGGNSYRESDREDRWQGDPEEAKRRKGQYCRKKGVGGR